MLDKLEAPKGSNKSRKRVGRGNASGSGKTCGRGHNGQNSRSGGGVKAGFEGGQMPIHRRLPKRGFTNIFRVQYNIVNVGDLERVFNAGDTVDKESLISSGLINKKRNPVKVLGSGDITKSLNVKVDIYSKSAIEKLKACGGTAEVL